MDVTPLPQLIAQLISQPIPLHLGALHPVEQVLVLLLAFGPFAALALVVVVRRRQDRAEQEASPAPRTPGPSSVQRER